MSAPFDYVVRPASLIVSRALGHDGGPSGALVLLHGRGADERDPLPLLDELDPEARLTGLTFRAPLELMPGGYQWYVVRRIGHPDETTFMQTFEEVTSWLDAELPRLTGVGWEQTVLGGFSQGAIMAYALALGRGRPSPRALVAFSGAIPEVPGFELDLESHRDMPVAIGHGALDPIVPVDLGRSAAERLQTAGFVVTYNESPLVSHGVDSAFARSLAGWLTRLTRQPRKAA